MSLATPPFADMSRRLRDGVVARATGDRNRSLELLWRCLRSCHIIDEEPHNRSRGEVARVSDARSEDLDLPAARQREHGFVGGLMVKPKPKDAAEEHCHLFTVLSPRARPGKSGNSYRHVPSDEWLRPHVVDPGLLPASG